MSTYDSIEITGETVGFFTANDPFFTGLNTVVSSSGGTITGLTRQEHQYPVHQGQMCI